MVVFTNIEATEADGATEPVTLAEAKRWLQVDFTDDDALITDLITAARETIEQYTNLALVDKTVTADAQSTCTGDVMRLPFALKATEVSVTDLETEETLAADEYTLRGNVLRVSYKGNYSLSYTLTPVVPKALKEAILAEVAQRYKNRGDNAEGMSVAAQEKANLYRVVWL